MKTLLYILTSIVISCIFISAIPFKKSNENICISLKCTNTQISETLMKESAKIIENRLKDIGYRSSQVTIADRGIIKICFKNKENLDKARDILTLKGKFEYYETVDRNYFLKNLKKGDRLFSGLNIPEENSEKPKMSNSILGYYSVNSLSESNEFIKSLNKGYAENIKFTRSKYISKEKKLSLYILKPTAFLDGNSISEIGIEKDKKTDEYFISMNFDDAGTKKWEEVSQNNIGKEIAMVLDDEVYFAPTVMAVIKEGKSTIAGIFSKDEASTLYALIKNGELPLEFEIIK